MSKKNSFNPDDIKRKQVAFNVADPHQKKLYEHSLKTTNFSAFIKSLIQRDMEKAQ